MTKVELLSLMRALVAVAVLPFAIRARMWFLTAGWVAGAVASICLSAGVALVLVGVIAMPMYFMWALHSLRVTRVRRSEPYFPRRSKPQQ